MYYTYIGLVVFLLSKMKAMQTEEDLPNNQRGIIKRDLRVSLSNTKKNRKQASEDYILCV